MQPGWRWRPLGRMPASCTAAASLCRRHPPPALLLLRSSRAPLSSAIPPLRALPCLLACLSQGLALFQGGVLMVSHDQHLIESTVDELWAVENGTGECVHPLAGWLAGWLAARRGGLGPVKWRGLAPSCGPLMCPSQQSCVLPAACSATDLCCPRARPCPFP